MHATTFPIQAHVRNATYKAHCVIKYNSVCKEKKILKKKILKFNFKVWNAKKLDRHLIMNQINLKTNPKSDGKEAMSVCGNI